MAFSANWIKYTIMGIVYGLEVISCVKAYLYKKGYEVDDAQLFKIIISKITGLDLKSIIKTKDEDKQ